MIIGSHHEKKIFGTAQTQPFKIPGYKSFPSYKNSTRKYEPSRNAVQRHMSLDLEVQFEKNALRGTCYLVLEGIAQKFSQVTLDARELICSQIQIQNLKNWSLEQEENLRKGNYQKIDYLHSDGVVTLNLAKEATVGDWFVVKIDYHVEEPKAGFYFVHKGQENMAKYDCVWTQGQDTDSSFWFPCQDDPRHKMTTCLTISFPKIWKGLSNGACLEEQEKGNVKTQKWLLDKPHAAYLVAFAAGDMHFAESTWEQGKPVQVLVPHEWKEQADIIVADTKRMMTFYSDYWDYRYAWNKYGQAFVAEFLYGGMENTSITINTDAVLGPKSFIESTERKNFLVMHEMAHQWFGDLVTCETWSEGWLNEGFATMSEMLWDEHENGKVSGIFYALDDYRDGYLAESGAYMRPVVSNIYEYVGEIFDAHLYNKAALILTHLRDVIGENNFRKSVGHYLRTREFKPVHTLHLMQAIEETTGWNPRAFFEQYIYRAGHVVLDVDIKLADPNSESLEISYTQKQDINEEFPYYNIDTWLHITNQDGKSSQIRVSINKDKGSVTIPLTQPIKFAVLDPQGSVVGKVTQTFPEWMSKNILSDSKNPNGYFKFLGAMSLIKSAPMQANLDLIAEWLKQEPVFRARFVAYKNLAETNPVAACEILNQIEEKHPIARSSWVAALGAVTLNKNQLEKTLEKLMSIAKNEKEGLVSRQNAVISILQLSKKNMSMRQSPWRESIVTFAREILKTKSHGGMLESQALKILTEFATDTSLLGTYPLYLNPEKNPWLLQAAAYQGYAQISARFPESRSEIRPVLSQLSHSLKPIRVISALPDIWQITKDPFYQEAFHAFIDRKNYGLLSMLIPRARRSRERYLKNLDANTSAEKFSELSDLKNKVTLLEAELKEIKARLPAQAKNKKNRSKVTKKSRKKK